MIRCGGFIYMPLAGFDVLWDHGWQAWYDQSPLPRYRTLGLVRFYVNAMFGQTTVADALTMGYQPDGSAVLSQWLGPRNAETYLGDNRLTAGMPELGQPSFVNFWAPIVADLKRSGGDFTCNIGLPPMTWDQRPSVIDQWAMEIEQAGMNLSADAGAAVDRLSYATPASVWGDRLAARGKRYYPEGGSVVFDAKLDGWFDGRFGFATANMESIISNPTARYVPKRGSETICMDPGSTATATRYANALKYCRTQINGSPFSAFPEMSDMTDAQVAAIVAAGGAA